MKRNKAPNSSNSVFYTYYHLRHDFGLRKQLGTEVQDSSLLWIDKSTKLKERKSIVQVLVSLSSVNLVAHSSFYS